MLIVAAIAAAFATARRIRCLRHMLLAVDVFFRRLLMPRCRLFCHFTRCYASSMPLMFSSRFARHDVTAMPLLRLFRSLLMRR